MFTGKLLAQQATSVDGVTAYKKSVKDAGEAARAYLESVARALTMTCGVEYGHQNAAVWRQPIASLFTSFKELPASEEGHIFTKGVGKLAEEIGKESYLQVLYLIRFFYLELIEAYGILMAARAEHQAANPSNHQVTSM